MLQHLHGIGWVIVIGDVDEAAAREVAQLAGVDKGLRDAVLEGERFVAGRAGRYEIEVNAAPDGGRVAEIVTRKVFRGKGL